MAKRSGQAKRNKLSTTSPEAGLNVLPWWRSWKLFLLATIVIAAAAVTGYAASKLLPAQATPATPQVIVGDGSNGPVGMVWIPNGKFLMGSDSKLAQANERPAHSVEVHGFWMDRYHVTNSQFAEFVKATGYVTTAERKPDWETIKPQVPLGTPKPPDSALVAGSMVFVGTDREVSYDDFSKWWRYVPGANWRHPTGPGSNIDGRGNHPVVQVSYEDALAYAKWAGKQLPTEAQWEFAARGGLEQATYAWGNEFSPNGKQMANVWQGQQEKRFPVVSAKAGGAVSTSPAGTFPPNGYGLYDMTGNAWQWVADWYRADQFARIARTGEKQIDPTGPSDSFDPSEPDTPADAPKRVTRGGSFLCNEEYCQSYRPSARRGTDPYTSMSHLGFRLIMTQAEWERNRQTKVSVK